MTDELIAIDTRPDRRGPDPTVSAREPSASPGAHRVARMSEIDGTGYLVRYDAMVSAIVACHEVDELKHLHDKALALELYAKQAKNLEAERQARDVRLRAEKALPEPPPEPPEYAAALESAEISTQSASRYKALADIPAEFFESIVGEVNQVPHGSMLP